MIAAQRSGLGALAEMLALIFAMSADQRAAAKIWMLRRISLITRLPKQEGQEHCQTQSHLCALTVEPVQCRMTIETIASHLRSTQCAEGAIHAEARQLAIRLKLLS